MAFKEHLETLASVGLTPYVASSKALLDTLDLSVLGRSPRIYLLEREADRPFHEAFLVAGTLGVRAQGDKLANPVLLDCVLLQTAIIGFALSRNRASDELINAFANIELDKLDYLPVSGQVAGLSLDGRLVGFSLFSLRRYLPAVPALGVITKASALLAYRARGRRFVGISQYDNKFLSLHGKFGNPMWIEVPTIPIHPEPDMSLVYGMTVDFDPDQLHERAEPGGYDFMMRADDNAKKSEIARGIEKGWRYVIVPPYQVEKDEVIYLPIRVETAP